MKHRASSTHKMDAPDRHNEQTDKQANKQKQTNGRASVNFVCLFVLDEVWR